MTPTPKRSECGCTVEMNGNMVPRIKFCPLHAVAKEMLEALKQMRLFIGYEPTSPIVKQFDDLISRAQKGVQ